VKKKGNIMLHNGPGGGVKPIYMHQSDKNQNGMYIDFYYI
jgi:hypothetical protein